MVSNQKIVLNSILMLHSCKDILLFTIVSYSKIDWIVWIFLFNSGLQTLILKKKNPQERAPFTSI